VTHGENGLRSRIRIIGIDPGAIYSGFALYDHEAAEFTQWGETEDPCVLMQFIVLNQPAVVALEDFIGAGVLNKERNRTIQILGYVRFSCTEQQISCYVRPPQRRLAYVSKVPRQINRKDERSAAAHALSFLEEFY